LILIGIVSYANSFGTPFVFDDEPNILENARIRSLWPLSRAMSAPERSGLSGRPILSLSLALNYALSGYKVWGYHAVNLAIHILAALTLYGIVRRTLLCERLRERFGDYAAVLAWAAAAIWLTHPVQTESVTYIIQRAESLMGLFYLLTLYFAMRAMQSYKPLLRLIASMFCCGLGMGTKEVMVTAPVMVLLYDRMFAAGTFISALRRRWFLYAGLAGTWGILAGLMWACSHSKTVGFSVGISPLDYAMNQCVVILHYIRLSVWPAGLCLDYSWPVVRDFGRLLPFAAVILVLGILIIWGLIRNQAWSYPAAWFFVILSPTSSFVPIVDLAFEHRVYLPLAGLIVLVVLAGHILSRQGWLTPLERRPARGAGLVLVAIAIVVLGLLTLQRNKDYHSGMTIWQKTLDIVPDNARAHYNLGLVIQKQGRLDEAISRYRQAIKLKPDHVQAYNNLGLALSSQGRFDEAAGQFNRALQLSPDFSDAYYNLAIALKSQGKLDDAITNYRLAIQFNPDYAEAHHNLGNVLEIQGKPDEAAAHYRQAIRIKPDDAKAHNNLGIILKTQGKLDEAISHYCQALQSDPNYAEACNNLGNVLILQNKLDEAAGYYRRALTIKPDYPEAYYNLGIVLEKQSKFREAVENYCQAVRLKPDWQAPLKNAEKILALLPDPNSELADRIHKRLELYKQVKP